MYYSLKHVLLILAVFFITAAAKENAPPFPRVWISYEQFENYNDDFQDLKAHGVGAVDVGRAENTDLAQLLAACRKHNMKIITRIETPRADRFETGKAEQAVMLGGAYLGKAIDRHRFEFQAEPQEIVLEAPVYHRDQVYGRPGNRYGHYYLGIEEPLRTEVIVKQKDYDGEQHLKIIPATVERIAETHWKMRFDLTGVQGDLQHVVLAAYWTCNAHRGGFRNHPTAFATSTHREFQHRIEQLIDRWSRANGGSFPDDVVIGLRYGDEEWHRSAHTSTSPAVSYPMWDYSDAAIAAFKNMHPNAEYPRGAAWSDMFGREAYADWLYSYHASKVSLVRTLKETLRQHGLGDVQIFRNTTRADVFSTMNDWDGTGQDLLAREFDIVHIDPYPVGAAGYRPHSIPIDMSYAAGLARRHDKYLMPWLQAHQYYPDGYFGLIHPDSAAVVRMLQQHRPHRPDMLMWLGYGSGSFETFPENNPGGWRAAGIEHEEFFKGDYEPVQPDFVAVRPYTVRALCGQDAVMPQDRFFTDTILYDAVVNKQWAYDCIEPRRAQELDSNELDRYSFILAELGTLSAAAVTPFKAAQRPCILFIQGADSFAVDSKSTGIEQFLERRSAFDLEMQLPAQSIPIAAADLYELSADADVLATVAGRPVAWRYGNLIFIAARGVNQDSIFTDWVWKLM